jgi:hypothetical protein
LLKSCCDSETTKLGSPKLAEWRHAPRKKLLRIRGKTATEFGGLPWQGCQRTWQSSLRIAPFAGIFHEKPADVGISRGKDANTHHWRPWVSSGQKPAARGQRSAVSGREPGAGNQKEPCRLRRHARQSNPQTALAKSNAGPLSNARKPLPHFLFGTPRPGRIRIGVKAEALPAGQSASDGPACTNAVEYYRLDGQIWCKINVADRQRRRSNAVQVWRLGMTPLPGDALVVRGGQQASKLFRPTIPNPSHVNTNQW